VAYSPITLGNLTVIAGTVIKQILFIYFYLFVLFISASVRDSDVVFYPLTR